MASSQVVNDGNAALVPRESHSRHEYDPPTSHDDPRICGNCVKGWGSYHGHLPYSILNTRTGKYHSSAGYGYTDCGIDATGEEFLWPM